MKKKLIIRESDFKRLPLWERRRFDRMTFVPITQAWLQKQVTFHTMKGNKKYADDFRHWQYPEQMLRRFHKVPMYDRRYKNWLVNYNEEGEMQVRAGINLRASRLGFGIFEKDEVDVKEETTN